MSASSIITDSNELKKFMIHGLDRPLSYPYSVSSEEMEKFRRKRQRSKELGIDLFVLDNEEMLEELEELECYIMDNYLDQDLDVPEDLKKKYKELKEQLL